MSKQIPESFEKLKNLQYFDLNDDEEREFEKYRQTLQ